MNQQEAGTGIASKNGGFKFSWRLPVVILFAAFIIYACFSGALTSVIIGCVIAYSLNILMSFYERHWFKRFNNKFVTKTRRPICLILAFISLLAIIALVVGLILPKFIDCVKLIIALLPKDSELGNTINKFINELTGKISGFIETLNIDSLLNGNAGSITSNITEVVEFVISLFSSAFSGVVTVLIGIIFAIYILLSKDKIGRQADRVLKHYLSDTWYERIKYAVNILNDCFHKYIVGQCIEAVILGALCTIGMYILGVPNAPAIGALVALTALIPFVGAYIGAGVGAFLILMESPIKALIFLIFLVILQQFEGNVIYPKVVGTSVGLPGIWVLAAVTVGGGVMGVAGMLLGVPLTAAVYRIIRNDVNKNADATSAEGDAENNAASNELRDGESSDESEQE